MPGVIEFLEKMGSDARWVDASEEAIERALDGTDIEEPVRAAIVSRDSNALQGLLNQPSFLGMQLPVPGEEEEEEDDEDAPGESPEPKDVLAARMRDA
jgi:hypothetical protein